MTEASATTEKSFHNPYFFGGGRARYLLTIEEILDEIKWSWLNLV